MKIGFSKGQLWSYLVSVFISVFLVAAFVFGATTINNNIDTGGTLTVSGASSLANATTSTSLYVSGVFQANGASSTVVNLVTVNASSTNATSTGFYVSGPFQANGASSTIISLVTVSATSTNATTTSLYVSGPLSVNGASSTILNAQLVSAVATTTSLYVSGGFQANGASSTITNLQGTFATSTRFDILSGSTAVYQLTPGASTTALIWRLGGTATTVLLNAYMNAFTFATSTDGTPVFSIDTTNGGRIGLGTTVPSTTFAIDSLSATTTLYLASPSIRTCIQLECASGTPYRLYINGGNSPGASGPTGTGALVVDVGSCL